MARHTERSERRFLSGTAPGLYLVLRPDFAIVRASDAYRRATLTWRDEIRAEKLFDVFPDNPGDPRADGVRNLRASIEGVLSTGAPHRMPVQRYDVLDRVGRHGGWIEKHWAPENRPVFGRGSREITHVVHIVRDVTRALLLGRWLDEQALVNREQWSTLERMRAELLLRHEQLLTARARIDEALHTERPAHSELAELEARLDAPESRAYLSAGDRVRSTGVYESFHAEACMLAATATRMRQGDPLPSCRFCGEVVVYRRQPLLNLRR